MNIFYKTWQNHKTGHKSRSSEIKCFINVLFTNAWRRKAEKILFGEPIIPYDIYPCDDENNIRHELNTQGITNEQYNETEVLLAEAEKLDNELFINPSFSFYSSPVREIFVWYDIRNRWLRSSTVSIYLLPSIIETLNLCHEEKGWPICIDKVNHFVKYTLAMENNFCFSITLR